MTTTTTDTDITVGTIGANTDPLGAAQARAVDDKAFATMLKQSGKAGNILGIGTNTKAASAFLQVVADEIAKPAQVILKMRSQKDGKEGAADFPTPELAPTLLLQFCGLVNNAIEHAQDVAGSSALNRCKGVELAKVRKNARNAIITKMERFLKPYGVTVNFSGATCAIKAPEAPKSDADKASERIVSAFAFNLRGSLAGLAALEDQAWSFVVAHVSRLDAERTAEQARENAEGLREAATTLAEKVKSMTGKADMVSLANAQREADAADAKAKAARKTADELTAALAA